MSNTVEIDIDFTYCGEVDMVLAHDECGEHEDVEFYRVDLLENSQLRAVAADAWRLFVKYGTVRPHDIAEVEAVMRRLRELRVGMD